MAIQDIILVAQGNKVKVTAEFHDRFKDFIDDNLGYKACGPVFGVYWRTLSSFYSTGICHPDTLQKIFNVLEKQTA